MTEKGIKRLRNIVVAIGIAGGFIIWLFVPTVIRNDSFMHVGNGAWGPKIGCLLLLFLPLIAFHQDKEELEFHAEDEEYHSAVRRKAAVRQAVYAAFTSALVLILMSIAMFR